jgi:hypothetical protein
MPDGHSARTAHPAQPAHPHPARTGGSLPDEGRQNAEATKRRAGVVAAIQDRVVPARLSGANRLTPWTLLAASEVPACRRCLPVENRFQLALHSIRDDRLAFLAPMTVELAIGTGNTVEVVTQIDEANLRLAKSGNQP